MNEELLSKYADRQGIESDTEFILNNLKLVKESFDALSSLRIKIDSAQSFGQLAQTMKQVTAAQTQMADSSTKVIDTANKLADQQKSAIPVYDALTDRIKRQTSAVDQSGASAAASSRKYDELINQLVANQIASDELRKTQSDLKKAYDNSDISLEQYEKSLADIKTAQLTIKISNQDLAKALNNMEKEAQSSAGSLNELRAQLNLAQQAYDKLSESERGTEAGGIIKKQVDDLNTAVSALEQGTGRFGRNVGNYSSAFKEALSVLEGQLKEINKEMARTGQGGAGYGELATQANVLDKIITELNGDFTTSRQALKALSEAATQAGLTFGLSSDRFTQIDSAIGKTINGINDIKAATKAQSQDAKFFTGLVSAVNGLVGAYGAAQAAAGLFTDESEESQKQMQKLQQLLVLITGLQQVANTVQEESGAIQLILSAKVALNSAAKKIQIAINTEAIAVIEAETVANIELAASEEAVAATTTEATVGTEAATVAQAEAAAASTALTTAISGGLLIVLAAASGAIVYLVSKIPGWLQGSQLTIKQQEALADAAKKANDVLAEQAARIEDLDGSTKRYYENQLALSQAAGQDQYKQFALQKQIAAEEQKLAQEQIDVLGATNRQQADLAGSLDDLNNKRREALNIVKQLGAIPKKDLTGDQKDQLEAANKNYDFYGKLYDAQKGLYDAGQAARTKLSTSIQKQGQIDLAQEKLTNEEIAQVVLQTAKIKQDAVIQSNQLILSNEASTRTQRIAAQKAILAAEIVTINAEAEAKLKDPSLTDRGRALVEQQAQADRQKAAVASREAIRQIDVDYDKRDREARAQEVQAKLSDQVKADQVIVDNEKEGYGKRLNALLDAYEKRKEIIGSQLFNELADQSLTDEQRIAIVAKANSDLLDEQRSYQAKYREIVKDNQAKILADAQAFYELRSAQINTDEANELAALNRSLGKNILAVEAYEKQRKDITDKYNIQRLQNQVAQDYNLVNSYKEGTVERAKAEEKLSKDVLALGDATVQKQIDDQKKLKQAYLDTSQAVQDAIFSVVEGAFESQKNALQAQIDLIAKQKQDAIDAENASGDAAQDKANKIATINAKAQADSERLQLRQKQLDIQKAKFEKAKSIAEIIEKTAIAVMEFLSEGNIPLSILAGITGAAQLAAVIATPIPQYRYGTGEEGHPGGLAITGDGGRPEPIIFPDGQMIMSPSTATVMDLPKGTIVMSSIQDMLASMESRVFRRIPAYTGRVQDNGSLEMAKQMQSGLKAVQQEIRNKPVAIIRNTYAGVQVSYQSAQSRWEWVNRNMQSN
jgi:hypothetical protein